MKKLFLLLMVALLGFASCSDGASSPSDAAQKITDLTINTDYTGVADMFHFENVEPEELDKVRGMLVGILAMSASNLENKGGIVDFKVLNETISEDGETAVVEAETTYGNGTSDISYQNYVLVDGQWMAEMGKWVID